MTESNAIVTLIEKNSGFVTDMELPTDVIVKDLSGPVRNMLSELAPRIFDRFKGVVFADDNGNVLQSNETLSSRGLWSGSIITVLEANYD